MNFRILLFVFANAFISLYSFGQVTDNFTDGDFTSSPTWNGDNSKFEVDASLALHLNAPAITDTAYLSTPISLDPTTTEWQCQVRMDFDPSSTNYTKIILMSDVADVKHNFNGYFLKIGGITGSTDAIELYKQSGATSSLLATGIVGHAAISPLLGIKVTRSSAGLFSVFADTTGSNNFVVECSATDMTFTSANYFGMVCLYTSTRSTLFWFDNIYIGSQIIDVIPPSIISVSAISAFTCDVLFNENINIASAENINNYQIAGVNPISASRDATNGALVHLTWASAFAPGTTYTLQCYNITDNAGNNLSSGSQNFSYIVAQALQVIITEIMPDPDPVVGLPNYEYIELYNTTPNALTLTNWTIEDPTTQATLPNIVLPSGGFLILVNNSNLSAFSAISNVYGISPFPSLNNSGDTLFLRSNTGDLMYMLPYNSQWYQNAAKADGGWSLEMIDITKPCMLSENWAASSNASGGTPSSINSIAGTTIDTDAPLVVSIFPTDSLHIALHFSEWLDISSATSISNFQLSNNTIIGANYSPFGLDIILQLGTALAANSVYTLTVQGLQDCSGNTIQTMEMSIGLPQIPQQGDLSINEVLFNPSTGGYDYVEIINNSQQFFDLNKLTIASSDSANSAITASCLFSEYNALLAPQAIVCLSANKQSTINQYPTHKAENIIENSQLPNFDDNNETVVLTNNTGVILDKLSYDSDWHLSLLNSEDGVSLERISTQYETQNKNNWASAAASVGFGTPGLKNSNVVSNNTNNELHAQPEVFTPNGDGIDDICTVNYNVDANQYIGNMWVLNEVGQIVKHLLKSESLSTSGLVTWDGTIESGEKAPIGNYIIYFEYFNNSGKVNRKKILVALGENWK